MAKTQNLDLNRLLPATLRNETLSSLVSNIFNRFVSEEKSVLINGRIGKPMNGDSMIAAANLEREVNALVPAIYLKSATEKSVYVFDDMVNKLKVLSADVDNMQSWMREPYFNFHMPINYDMFVNFNNYYWVGQEIGVPNTFAGNPDNEPVYYVVERPTSSSKIKSAVRLVTTRDIKLNSVDRDTDTIKIRFLSSAEFTVLSDQGPVIVNDQNITGSNTYVLPNLNPQSKNEISLWIPGFSESTSGYGLEKPFVGTETNDPLLSFTVEMGAVPFSAGDEFTITVEHRTSNIQIAFDSLGNNKGFISGPRSLLPYRHIDGIEIRPADRILVANQTDATENGIYIVSASGTWARERNARLENDLAIGATVFVTDGSHARNMFELTAKVNALPIVGTDPLSSELVFTNNGPSQPNVNDWQEQNFWWHIDDFALLPEDYNVDFDKCIRATRPIIEYSETVQLNGAIIANTPCDSGLDANFNIITDGLAIKQTKESRNQPPQFDLYYFDGTHAGKTSPIFYYLEDQDYNVDPIIGRRLKTNANSDYVFQHGLVDEEGRLLFYKKTANNGALSFETAWVPGLESATVVSIKASGAGTPADINITDLKEYADTQTWSAIFGSDGKFELEGERSGIVGKITPGVLFSTDNFDIEIAPAAYAHGDSFGFDVLNTSFPRYVKKVDDRIINYPGGPTNDGADGVIDGAWMTPLRMFQNLEKETQTEVMQADLAAHFRAVILNQDGFRGSSFGNNNVRKLDFNPGLGGSIREYGKDFPLLVSMLIQQDISPITIIDFAENQYAQALATLDAFITEQLPSYVASGNPISLLTIEPTDPRIISLVNAYCETRKNNDQLTTIFGDSTALVPNWPVTLPMIGLVPRVYPTFMYDSDLGINVLRHHDGHISAILDRSIDTDRLTAQTVVTRSDGTQSPGIFSETMPTVPYAGQLWVMPASFQMFIFNVNYDNAIAPVTGAVGELWFNRADQTIHEWNVSTNEWQLTTLTVANQWIPFNVENVRHSFLLAIEMMLYDSVHPLSAVKYDVRQAEGSVYAPIELARFASKYQFDTFAPNYVVGDAYTWNYSSATISGITGAVPARWFNIYKDYFDRSGFTLPTARPNAEPWKLLNHADKPAWWDATYANGVAINPARLPNVQLIEHLPLASMGGAPIIDGVQTVYGDRVLLNGQVNKAQNGIFVITPTGWIRSNDVIAEGSSVQVEKGLAGAHTFWTMTTPGPVTLGTSLLDFKLAKAWKNQMWDDIRIANPGMKLCVNTFDDSLIPPYVAPSNYASAEALLTTIPPGISNVYVFNDDGPTEMIWKRSLEYLYGLARSAFRLNPLDFLSDSWGHNYLTTYPGGVQIERNLGALHPHTKYLLHGERYHNMTNIVVGDESRYITGLIEPVNPLDRNKVVRIVVSIVNGNDTFFDIYVDDVLVAYMQEDAITNTFIAEGVRFDAIEILSRGKPFNVGDTFVISMFDDIVDPSFVPLDDMTGECVGCVADGSLVSTIPMVSVDSKLEFIPSAANTVLGLGQVFTNLIRMNYVDQVNSPTIRAYREWELKLVHRLGALIRDDTLTIDTSQGRLSETAYEVILKKSPNVDDLWITGLRVQLVEKGAALTNKYGYRIPSNDASDWKFRIETYNTQNPVIEKYRLDTSSDFQTFSALSKVTTDREWRRYTEHTAIEEIALPLTVTGLQNVLDFLYGYITRLEDRGWRVHAFEESTIDAETSRSLDWQLEVEKLVDRVYKGMDLGEGHVLNPFMEFMNLKTPHGLMATYSDRTFIDMFSAQGAYDIVGNLIPVPQLNVIRTDDQTVTYSQTPLFSAHVFIDEYEHAIVFNNKFTDAMGEALLFSPFLGLRIQSAFLAFIRQEEPDGKPTFDGFFLSGDKIKRNIVSTVDSMAHYYDADKTFLNPETARHATALLGFTRKDYFDPLAVNDTTQFNFWRGLIQAKGTNMSIDAFVNFKKFTDAAVDEYWAYKIAEYGDARELSSPEIKIGPEDTTQKFIRLQFYSGRDDVSLLPLFTHIENSDDTRWFSIDDLGKGMRFETSKVTESVMVDSPTYPAYVKLKNIYHTADGVEVEIQGAAGASMVTSKILKVNAPGEYHISGFTWINATKHSPMKLIDYENKVVLANIQLWHPAIGIHAQAPLDVVDIIANNDPARYNFTTKTVDNENFHSLKPWSKKEVGRVWWNTQDLSYIPYEDEKAFPNRDARLQRWGLLADWSTIELYEWVESDVKPEFYNAVAAKQEGNADLDNREKASGKVAVKNTYVRDRIIKRRPIAWSKAGVGAAAAHPSFGPAEFTAVYAFGRTLIADRGRCEAINLVQGRNFGGWLNNKPVGEVRITNVISYFIGALDDVAAPVVNALPVSSGTISDVTLSVLDDSIFGAKIGVITLKKKIFGPNDFGLRMTDSLGEYEDVRISDWYCPDANADVKMNIDFEVFGIRITITRSTFGSTPFTGEHIIDSLSNPTNDIFVREAVDAEELIPLPDQFFINDDEDPRFVSTEYEWRTWAVPTQAHLDKDLAHPFNEWKAYVGDETTVTASPAIIAEMTSKTNKFKLRTGEVYTRYSVGWTDWTQLQNQWFEKISNGVDYITFQMPEVIDSNRVSVYANGSQVKPSGFLITGDFIQLLGTYAEGTIITLLNRAFAPAESELNFDPAVSDDFTRQKQYKSDYEYTMIQYRDDSGNLAGHKYYFWVKDKSIPQYKKSMSLLQAKAELQHGPQLYAVMARALTNGPTPFFDSCCIAGLPKYVTRENAIKIKFIRNFILRDDPEEMDLKNVHTEWALIRRGQIKKIPAQLWNLVSIAAANGPGAGNQAPTQARIDYDERNGTSYRYGFGPDQIFADSDLVKSSIIDTILNTKLSMRIGGKKIINYIHFLDFDEADTWLETPEKARQFLNMLYESANAAQVNEIFFNVLDDALSNNLEISDIFKTSYITVSSTTEIKQVTQQEQQDELF